MKVSEAGALVRALRAAAPTGARHHLYWQAADGIEILARLLARVEEENDALMRPSAPAAMIRLRQLLAKERERADKAERKLRNERSDL